MERPIETVAAILDAAIEGASRTEIMYDSYLDWHQMNAYLTDLAASGLINCNQFSYYQTTKRGKSFLALFHRLDGHLPTEQRQRLPRIDKMT